MEQAADERLVSGSVQTEDAPLDRTLRPRHLGDYIGQDRVKENLSIGIQAAKMRGEPLDHILLYGPPGLGKTSMAFIIGEELGVEVRTASGPTLERGGDLAAILNNMQAREVLFIDEIHRLNRAVEEVLYPAMEDFFVSWVIDKGLRARSMNLSLNPFTFIGATTRYGMVSSPLRDRFGSIFRLDFYEESEIRTILDRSSRILDIKAEPDGLSEIARRARGTPRVANRLLKRVRDYAQVEHSSRPIDAEIAAAGLELHRVDPAGLEPMDHQILLAVPDRFDGGPVGIESLAAILGEERETIEAVYEPFLVQEGYLERTPRGRIATRRAYDHFGRDVPTGPRQGRLL